MSSDTPRLPPPEQNRFSRRTMSSPPPPRTATQAKPPTSPKRFSWFTLFVLSTIITLCSFMFLVRSDEPVQMITSIYLLRLEKELDLNLTPIKRLLGIRLNFSHAEFFDSLDVENAEAVDILLSAGMDVNTVNEDNSTGLHLAVKKGNMRLTKLFLARSSKIDAQDSSGETPLHYAIRMQHTALFQLLVSAGANVNVQNNEGETALLLATQQGNFSIAKNLLVLGANANVADNNSKTPLMHAIQLGNVPLVEELLRRGANPKTTDSEGRSAFVYALTVKNVPIYNLLNQSIGQISSPRQTASEPSGSQTESQVETPAKNATQEQPSSAPKEIPPIQEETKELPVLEKKTRLRVVGKPQGTWRKRRGLTLEKVKLDVRNVGSIEAEDIKVLVEVPGGELIELSGPETLAPNKAGTYTAEPWEDIVREGELKPKLICSNCLK